MASWALAAPPAPAAVSDALPPVALSEAGRAVPIARSRPELVPTPVGQVTLVIDGHPVTVDASSGETVADLLATSGIILGPADRLSLPAATRLLAGMRVALDRGLPVTLVDGGRSIAMRARPGTVADFLAASGISVSAQDVMETLPDTAITPDAVVRIDRIADTQVVETASIPHGVSYIEDTTQEIGWQRLETPGADGQARLTFLVRVVNGIEIERALVSSEQVVAPVAEVRRIGARPRPAPAAPGDIEAIIRAAAAKYGVDAQQLLRVAWCESRYNPNAYNSALGASGLFQFIPGTWAANSARAGYGGASVFDPVANANVAAWMFAHGQSGQWVCK